MISKSLVILVAFSFMIQAGIAQTYPYLLAVDVKTQVVHDTLDSYYYFTYSLTNGISSIGQVQTFRVDISRRPSSVQYDTVGLRFAGSSFLQSNFRRHYPALAGRIVPSGFAGLPEDWSALWGNTTFASMGLIEGFVAPGNTVTGLVLMSKGLPTIRSFVAQPHFNDDALFPSIEDSLSTVTPEQIDSIREAVNYHSFTVGPGAPDSLFRPQGFIDTISSCVQRSRAFTWISTQQNAEKYAGLLSRIKNDCVQFNLKLARSRIDTVLQQTNIDSSSALTSEAYALIRFNTEYLRDKLKPTGEVQGGIFMPSSGMLSVKAKSSVAFGKTDTLKSIMATARWPAMYNVTLGTVSGSYGFSKYDSIITSGAYRYQKFRTTTSQIVTWSPGREYELFTLPVSGLRGAETFELTNALVGGEWFVDINYLDKTESVFYQPVARGHEYQNK